MVPISVGISASSNALSGGPFSGGNSIFNFGYQGSVDAAENGFNSTPTQTATSSATGQGNPTASTDFGGAGGGGGGISWTMILIIGAVAFLFFKHKL